MQDSKEICGNSNKFLDTNTVTAGWSIWNCSVDKQHSVQGHSSSGSISNFASDWENW
jgi:hypothetical protein